MTGCEEIRPLISSYVDGEASTKEISLVQAHLKACDKCQSHLAFLKMLGPAINHAPIAAPSPLLFERIAKATYAKPTWQQRYLGWLAPLPLRWTVTSGLVAAGVVAVLVAPRVMNMTPGTTDAPTVAVNKPVTPPVAIDGVVKPAASPTPVPDVARPSVVLPTPAPIAAKPAETRTNTRTDHAVTSESSATRVAAALKVKPAPRTRVGIPPPVKPAGGVLANTTKPNPNPTKPVVIPSPLPTPPPKVTVTEPIEIAAATNRDTNPSTPGTSVSKTVKIAANVMKPEEPSFTTSAAPDPEEGNGGRKVASFSFKGMNTSRPAEVADVNRQKLMAQNSALLGVAAPVK